MRSDAELRVAAVGALVLVVAAAVVTVRAVPQEVHPLRPAVPTVSAPAIELLRDETVIRLAGDPVIVGSGQHAGRAWQLGAAYAYLRAPVSGTPGKELQLCVSMGKGSVGCWPEAQAMSRQRSWPGRHADQLRVRPRFGGAGPLRAAWCPSGHGRDAAPVSGFAKRFSVAYLQTRVDVPTTLVALDAAGHEVARI